MDTTAMISFLAREEVYKKEKPDAIQYEPHGDVPQSNVVHQYVPDIPIKNIRPIKDELTLEKHDLLVRQLDMAMTHTDFGDPATVQSTYLPRVNALSREALRTKNIAILEYIVRRSDRLLPRRPDREFEHAQPVPTAHIGEFRIHSGSIWRGESLEAVEVSVCDCEDNVFPKVVEESIECYYGPHQEWCFLDQQLENEAIIFRGGDSKMGIRGGVPHCSFEGKRYGDDVRRRESVEVRLLAFFTDHDLELERVVPSRRHGPKSAYAQGLRADAA